MNIILLAVILLQIWNPMAGYWTDWHTVKSGYCNKIECYVDVMTDLWGRNTKRIHLVYWVHRDTTPGRYCRFGGLLSGRYRRAECRW